MTVAHFALQENILKNAVFVDGLARSGKSLFSNVIGTLENAEHLMFFNPLEHVVPALSFGSIKPGYARSIMRTQMNELAYNTLLARNANFRPNDQTGVLNHWNSPQYVSRLNREEGDNVVEELRSGYRLFPFMTHDMMVNLEHLESLEINFRMIQVLRNPIDLICSWHARGWGERYMNDPRSFTLSIEYQGNIMPWYCAGCEQKWLDHNSMERCALNVLDLYDRAIAQYKKTLRKDRILLVSFEEFVQHPDVEMERISAFLDTKTTPWTKPFLEKANCPRILDSQDRERKRALVRAHMSGNLLDRLLAAADSYEVNSTLSDWSSI